MRTMTRYQGAFSELAAGALLGVAAAVSAGSPPEASAPQPIKDAWIDGRVETTYALNPHLNPFAIDTRVENGVVILSGTLASDIDRDLAIEIAEAVDGVVEVRSELTVDATRSAPPPSSADRGFPQWIKDATTTARVKSNLIANGNTRGLGIEVDTRNDVVTLRGAVSSQKQKMLAEMIARNTAGIVDVHNQLDVDEQS